MPIPCPALYVHAIHTSKHTVHNKTFDDVLNLSDNADVCSQCRKPGLLNNIVTKRITKEGKNVELPTYKAAHVVTYPCFPFNCLFGILTLKRTCSICNNYFHAESSLWRCSCLFCPCLPMISHGSGWCCAIHPCKYFECCSICNGSKKEDCCHPGAQACHALFCLGNSKYKGPRCCGGELKLHSSAARPDRLSEVVTIEPGKDVKRLETVQPRAKRVNDFIRDESAGRCCPPCNSCCHLCCFQWCLCCLVWERCWCDLCWSDGTSPNIKCVIHPFCTQYDAKQASTDADLPRMNSCTEIMCCPCIFPVLLLFSLVDLAL